MADKIRLKWAEYGLIVHPDVSFRVEEGRIYDIDGIYVDIPGPLNPKLTEIQFGREGLTLCTQVKDKFFPWPQFISELRSNAAMYCALKGVDIAKKCYFWAYDYVKGAKDGQK